MDFEIYPLLIGCETCGLMLLTCQHENGRLCDSGVRAMTEIALHLRATHHLEEGAVRAERCALARNVDPDYEEHRD